MTQLLDIFGFLSVLLRGLTLSFEALAIGGVVFLLAITRSEPALRAVVWFAGLLAAVEACSVALNGAILAGTTGMSWSELAGASFCISGLLIVAGALGIAFFARTPLVRALCPICCALILAGSVMNSHSFARIDYRWTAMALTGVHHLAGAAWIGGMLYLLLTLRRLPYPVKGAHIVSRFSRLAILSVSGIALAGVGLSLIYVASPAALMGTIYGIMLIAKIALTAAILFLGALNLRIVRAARADVVPGILPLQRFGEAELGIGFTILLAAASLTSTPPAVDVQADLVAAADIPARMMPRWPRLQTPSVSELSPATPIRPPEDPRLPRSFVPGQFSKPNSAADIDWSEYNHHWAGIVVAAVGILSLLARRLRWARIWPLAFLGLAVFLFLRADSENWPLGPRGFWESFQVAEVAQHRVFVLLIVLFALFEWAVQTRRLSPSRAGLVFPLVCALGGALLLTHSHSLGNVRDEYFAEMSHISLACLAVLAGWSRWLEIRLPPRGREYFVAWVWPACFILIGAILLSYREI